MSFRYEIRLSGSGGQGLVLAGQILAEAAAIYDGKNATQSQSYGPEARGGSSRSEVIISDEEIDYPKAVSIDLLLCFTQEAWNKYGRDLKPGGILIIDSDFVTEPKDRQGAVYALPIAAMAEKAIGRSLVANIVALGLITGITGIVTKESMETAIQSRVPKGTEKINLKAFGCGFDKAIELKTN
ncbi:2-oxoglutarate ferredoxin oxidoreductase subunit gamma [candidate division WOR-3 bacterium RBG_13_43_14]|uniref:2-oxoglutarate ferredoxin oxidoreductase subunit gamma n=1 Tax=candidate division WOR-3 bacterium RBG_13_43_14 TaxID=1802590 RepID=A0A1F4U1G3_UNCW3|nr:MAG: 2-oxoglutarate ferredoxin oxidoreductase subunit gamma [candidate division WOR-3 bacterium RBG_13_43_14]